MCSRNSDSSKARLDPWCFMIEAGSMSAEGEIEALRGRLDELARDTNNELIERYELRRPPMPPGLYWRMRWLAGWVVRWLKSMPIWRSRPWPVSLRQARSARAKPFLIWAVGTDRETLRAACGGFSRMQSSWRGFAPVLVTDVADFAFFSRLGWLVEYLPRLAGAGPSYAERKLKFLTRVYHGVPALPLSVGLITDCPARELRRWLSIPDKHPK